MHLALATNTDSVMRCWSKRWKRRTRNDDLYLYFNVTTFYNSETWTLREEEKRKLRVFEMAVLRKIEGITRIDRKRNVDVKNKLGITRDVVDRIQERRLRYFGHVVRMNSSRTPNIALYGRVEGKRSRGRPRKSWTDNVKEDGEAMGMSLVQADRIARDRGHCGYMLYPGCRNVRQHRHGIKSKSSSRLRIT